MEITDVRIFKARRKGVVLAYANVILDGKFIIRGIALVETEKNRRFISMPSRRLRNGERSYRDVCHPLNSDVRAELTEKIFAAYDELIESKE